MDNDEIQKPKDTSPQHEAVVNEFSPTDLQVDNMRVISPSSLTFKDVVRNLIFTLFALVVFYIFSTIFGFIIIGTNVDAFKGEVYGILQSTNGYGTALAFGLGGLLTIFIFRKRGKIPVAVIAALMLLLIPGFIYSESDEFDEKVTTQIREEIQEEGLSLIEEQRKVIRDDFNSQGTFLYPKNINKFRFIESEWSIDEVPSSNTQIKTLNLTLIRDSDNGEIEIYYSKFRVEPNLLNTLDTFTTNNGIDFVRLPHSSSSTSMKMVLYSTSEFIENKVTLIYNPEKVSNAEAKEVAYSLEMLSPELIILNQEVCNQNSYDSRRVCEKEEF